MKSSKLYLFALAALTVISCGKTARIEGTIAEAPSDTVVVKMLEINTYRTLDTLTTSAAGKFSCKVDVAEGQPEFIYLFHGDTKIASLLLQTGDKVFVTADTKGNYSVEGSEESVKLQGVEKDFSEFMARFVSIVGKSEGKDVADVKAVSRKLSGEYIAYYRKAIKYITENSHSLTVVPVFFQKINPNFPVFSRRTDAILMAATCDSLKTVYPESRYVKALEKEAARRMETLDMETKLSLAEEMNFPDLQMPDINGTKAVLSEVNAKVTMLHFWAPDDTKQVLMNTEVLKPVYEKYHSLGFEIYEVGITVDKVNWATVVRNQKLPWINVCDGLGTASPSLSYYNVGSLPIAYLISDGALVEEVVSDEASLRNYLDRKLK